MAEKLFPLRQRCKTCAKRLGDGSAPVWKGLFCSARCAGVAPVVSDPDKAPRECKTQRDGAWVFKRRYRSESEIPDKLRNDVSVSFYTCTNCWHLHLGHSRIDTSKETHRVVPRMEDLADVLIKARGKATRKQVAAVAGIRPIRLKELEEPAKDQRVDPEALLAVLSVYQMKLSVVLRN